MKLRYKIANGILIFLAVAVTALALVLSYTADCELPAAPDPGATTMKAITYSCYGSPDVLEFVDMERPVPGDDEVLISVQAAAVNPLDWHFMRGSPYFMRLASGIGKPKGSRLGRDFAGTVEAVGKDVTRLRPGDHVFGGADGAFGEYVLRAEDSSIVPMPADATFEQAASMPVAGLTALQALRDHGQLEAGQKVLINGASGGVGTFAVQIAKSMGAEVHGVCSTRNVEMVQSIGADHVFDYKKESYLDSGEQYDLIVDMVGNHSLRANRAVMTPSGRLVIVGGPKGDWVGPMVRPIGAMLLSPFVDQDFITILARFRQADLVTLGELLQSGEVTPVIDRRYSLSEVPAAIRYSEEGHARGKIIITVSRDEDNDSD